ncbi:MAG: discoidin domain-containing protein [Niabella sp.]
MKTIFLALIASVLFYSCKQEAIPIPESLLIEETDLTLVAEGETYLDRIYSTAGPIEAVIPADAKEWLSASMKDKHLEIVAQRNASISPRSASITVKTKERSTTIKIKQTGLPTRKLKITGGKASSEETSEGPFARSWDGDYTTYWHSRYSSPSTQYEDHTLQYDLEEGSGSIDLILIYPRNNAGAANGRWGYYCVYVKGDGTNTPSTIPGNTINWGGELGSVDSEGYKLVYKGDDTQYFGSFHVTTIVLPVPIANPNSVKILINGTNAAVAANTGGSRGGFGSLAEIEFYGKVN